MEEWKDYLGGAVLGPEPDLRIATLLDQEQSPNDLERLEKERFRWLLRFYVDRPDDLFSVWKDSDFILDERKALRELELQQFYANSSALCALLLRKEVRNLSILKQLRDSICCRCREREKVLYFGPTSGAEMEAIFAAGAFPVLVTDQEGAKWETQMEARLIDNFIPFEVVSKPSCSTSVAVLSPWITNAKEAVASAVKSVGLYGFLVHPFTNLSLGHEVKKLNLRQVDTYQAHLGVWFKPPSHSLTGAK